MPTPGGSSPVTFFPLSGDNTLDALINFQYKWGSSGVGTAASVTYSFPQAGASWASGYGEGEPGGLTGFNASQQAAATQALNLWAEVANITFTQVADTAGNVGDIRFGFSSVVTNDPNAIAWGYFPYASPEAGDVWLDPAYNPNLQMAPGQFGFSTLLHEIGHAIGLDHPFDDGFGEPTLPAAQDNNQYTIMAYATAPGSSVEAMSPMLLDILAIQYLYGANMATRAGDDVYSFSATSEVLKAIWDAGGNDTIDASNQTLAAKIDLNDGAFSSIGKRNAGGSASNNIAIAYGVMIENAKGGSGADTITGNEVANLLYGNAGADTLTGGLGNDTLDGGTGADRMRGGVGNDYYFVDSTGDTIDEQGSTDKGDQIFASVSVNLTTLGSSTIENVILISDAALSITGSNANNFLAGREGANTIAGGGGDDFLFGLGGNDTLTDTSGSNYMEGGAGNDTMTGGTGTDAMYGGDGNDVMNSGAGASNYLDGGAGNDKLTGGAGNDTLLGGDGTDTLTGNAGADFLDGGTGDDVMTGGAGADIYVVDSLGDKVVETGTDGPDEIRTIFDVDLGTFGGGTFEHTRLLGNANLNATGNAAFNLLWGNNGINILQGLGGGDLLDAGLGADVMKGGSGNDIYVVENAGDVVDEEGNTDLGDTVMGIMSFDLNTFSGGSMENAILLGPAALNAVGSKLDNQLIGGSGANTLTGNDGNDTLIGNDGDDTLLGGNDNDILVGGLGNDTLNGGSGTDTLIGSEGNDIYILADQNDTISEGTNKDTGDEIQAAFSVNLAAFDGGSIENATLLGTADINATGTAANNKLIGNSGVNTLDGGIGNDYLDGGLGDDVLRGGAGNDTYVLDSLTDTIDEQGSNDTGDEVQTGIISVALATFSGGVIENATLLGNLSLDLTGTTFANKLTGNSAANTLDGGGGNDVLDGGGGDDKLIGGAGNDVYVVDTAGDVVDEQGSDSGDEVRTGAFSLNLSAFGKIENGALLGSANLDITGNGGDNVLTGNSGKNTLDGGIGNDTLRGGAGNDVYIVDSYSDVIDEQGNADTGDEVRSKYIALDLSILGGGAIESATLLGTGLGATGNARDNILTGNIGNNALNGAGGNDLLIGNGGNDDLDGGTGNDVMKGGAGNDTYYVDSLQDTVDEEGNTDSADTIRASINVDLSVLGGGAIENAYISNSVSAPSSLKGNDSNNELWGNAFANTLDGGKGDDTLIGNGGADTFLGGEGNDYIEVEILSNADWTTLAIDGGAGTDRLRLTSQTTIDFTTIAQSVVQNVEVIDLTLGVGSKLIVSAQDVADLSGSSADLFVLGDANDSVVFTDSVKHTGQTTISGIGYEVYSYGASTVYVDTDVKATATPPAAMLLSNLDDSLGFRIAPTTPDDLFGSVLAAAGDVNDDGFEDLLITGGKGAYLLYGQAGAYDGPLDAINPAGASVGELIVNNGWNSPVSGLGDFNGDGVADFTIGDPGADFGGGIWSGGAYVVYGDAGAPIDQLTVSTLGAADAARFGGAASVALTSQYRGVGEAGDLNGDGYDDLLVSAYTSSSGSANGIAYVAFGRSDQPATILASGLNGNNGFSFNDPIVSYGMGKTISGGIDVNGDGYDDLVVSQFTRTHVIFGHQGTFDANLQVSELNGANGFTITTVNGGTFNVGYGGDFNGDGYQDIVLSNPAAGTSNAGAVYVVFGHATGFGTIDVSQLNGANGFAVTGVHDQKAGETACLAGDYNGDGYDDLLIGAPGAASVFVVYGHAGASSATMSLGSIDGFNGFQIVGDHGADEAGYNVAASDLNGDGFDDLVFTTGANNPRTYVYYGKDYTAGETIGTNAGETLNGTSSANMIVAGQGNDIINGGGGADAINGGQGNDEIHVADNKFFRIDGGTGVDTLHLDYSGAIDFGNLDGNASTSDRGRIENVEILDVVNGQANAMTLHLADILDLDVTVANVGGVAALDDVLRIDGDAGDTLKLFSADGWGAADTSSLAGYAIYSYQAVKVAVDTDIAVSIT